MAEVVPYVPELDNEAVLAFNCSDGPCDRDRRRFFQIDVGPQAPRCLVQGQLGLSTRRLGGRILKWPEDQAEDRGVTVWHVAERESKWFSPSTSSFMINYRVDDLTALLAQLKSNGVEILKGPDSDENGKFAWIMDPDGNKVELWEPMIWDEKNKKA